MTPRWLALSLLVPALPLSMIAAAPARTAVRHPAAASAARAHLQVIEIEYRLILSRGVVKAGPVSLEALNRGMDPHDMRLRQIGGSLGVAAPQLSSGGRWDDVVNLRPGLYHLWCSLPQHERLGMHATLRVVP
jgi:hypothetical protein